MKKLIYIGSVNQAMKAKKLLASYGISSSIERSRDASHLCGYALLVVNEPIKAQFILKDNGII